MAKKLGGAAGLRKATNDLGKAIDRLKRNNTTAARTRLTQQYAAAGNVVSRGSIARKARTSMGGAGG